MGFKIPNITFSGKVYLKSRVDWPRIGDDLLCHNWNKVYNNPNPASELNRIITSLIDRRVPSIVVRWKVNADSLNAFNDKQNTYRLWSQKYLVFSEDHEKGQNISTFHFLLIFLGDFYSLWMLDVSTILSTTCIMTLWVSCNK